MILRLAALVIIVGEAPLDRDAILRAIDGELQDRRTLVSISLEERFVLAGDLERRVVDCGSDTACLANALRSVDADLGLLVVINGLVDPALTDVRLIGIDAKKELGRDAFASARVRAVGEIATRAARLLDTAGHPAFGRLKVAVTPPDAEVVVGEALTPDVAGRHVYTLKPATYSVLGKRDGYESTTATVAVTARSEVVLPLVLAEHPSVLESPYLWVGVGLAVIAAGTVTAVLLTRSSSECFCVVRPGVDCTVCE